MKAINQRSISLVLLIALFLQSCGVNVPVRQPEGKRYAVTLAGPVVEGRAGSSAVPEVGEIQTLQVDSVEGTRSPSQAQSATASPSLSLGTISRLDAGDQLELKISDENLVQYVGNSNYASTEELVTAFNTSTASSQEEYALYQWLQHYVDSWFVPSPIGQLDQRSLQEYVSLSQIKPSTNTDVRTGLLKSYCSNLMRKIVTDVHIMNDEECYLIQALDTSLQQIDDKAFTSTQALIDVGNHLLEKLDPHNTELNETNYVVHECLFNALHSVLFSICKLDQTCWSSQVKGGLYKRFQNGLVAIQDATSYYPVVYQSLLLEQSLRRLERKESRFYEHLERIWQFAKGLSYAYNAGIELASNLKIELTALEESWKCLHSAIKGSRIQEENWYDHLIELMYITADLTLKDSSQHKKFLRKLATIKKAVACEGVIKEGFQPLCYGVAIQLTILSLEGKSQQVRQDSLNELKELSKDWSKDQAMIEGVLNGLASVARQTQQHTLKKEGSEAKKYLENLEQEVAQFEREQKEKTRNQRNQHTQPYCNSWLCCIFPDSTSNSTGNSSKYTAVEPKPVVKAMQTWLAGQSLEKKLSKPHIIERYAQQDQRDGALFNKVKDEFLKELKERIDRQESMLPRVSSIREALVKHYSEALSTLPSLLELEEEKEISTSSVACQLWRHEEVREQPSTDTAKADNDSETGVEERDDEPIEADSQKHSALGNLNHMSRQVTSKSLGAMPRLALAQYASTSGLQKSEQHVVEVKGKKLIKKPIGLQDIFANTGGQTQRGSTKVTQKVCIIGDAGTGKTSITYKLAYEWAQDNWGREFEVVYVLSVRNLREDKYNDRGNYRSHNTLATAIINECLPNIRTQTEQAYDQYRKKINTQLNEPTTLIILDGLDERAGTSKEITQEALGGKHKLIVTSRPHAVSNDDYDVTIEHKGFSQAQKEDYVRQILTPTEAKEFLSAIQDHTGISDITHLPLNLKICCYLWKEREVTADSVRQLLQSGSISRLYQAMTQHLWKRYQRREIGDYPSDEEIGRFEEKHDALFDAIEKVAWTISQNGIAQVTEGQLKGILEKRQYTLTGLEKVGFLQKRGNFYEFPHSTFQEYFAGKALAEEFIKGDTEELVVEFLQENKYSPRYTHTLIFATGALSQRSAKTAKKHQVKKLISNLGSFYQILNTEPKEEAGVQHLLLELKLLNEWLLTTNSGCGDCSEACKSSGIEMLNQQFSLGERLKSWLRAGLCEAGSTYNPYTTDPLLPLLLKPLVQLKGISDTSAYGQVIEEVFQEAVEHYDLKRSSAALAHLPTIAKANPQLANRAYEMLEACLQLDNKETVRSSALSALAELLQVKADKAEDVFSQIKKHVDPLEPTKIRESAISAVVGVAKADPDLPGSVLAFLEGMLPDSVIAVRTAVLRAMPRLVKKEQSSDNTQVDERNLLEAILSSLQSAIEASNPAAVQAAGVLALAEEVVSIAPKKGKEVLALIDKSSKSGHAAVRRACVDALANLDLTEIEDALPIVYSLIQRACRDWDGDVKSAGIRTVPTLASLVTDRPDLVEEAWILVKQSLSDDQATVRQAGIEALLELHRLTSDQQGEIFDLLQTKLQDKDSNVRAMAVKKMSELAVKEKDLVEKTLQQIQLLLQDKDVSVQKAARSALGSLAQEDAACIRVVKTTLEESSSGPAAVNQELVADIFDSYSTDALVNACNKGIPAGFLSVLLGSRLYRTSLVFEKDQGLLTLYHSSGKIEHRLQGDSGSFGCSLRGNLLWRSAYNGYLEVLRDLAEHGASVEIIDNKYAMTGVHAAAYGGHLPVVTYLKDQGAAVDTANKDGWTPMHQAARNGHLPVVTYLKDQGAAVDTANKDGWTPMHQAARNGHLPVVTYLKDQGAAVDTANKYGWTPMFLAAQNGHLPVVTYLKDQGAAVDMANKDGWTPMLLAAQNGHLPVVTYLKDQGAAVDTANKDGWTPMHQAARNGHLPVVTYLKDQGAAVDTANKDGWTPMHSAAQNGHLPVVTYLKEQEAAVDTANKDGWTPMHSAAQNGHLPVVTYLKEQGAAVDTADGDGVTPMHLAAHNGHLPVVTYLEEQGANVNVYTAFDDTTPLQLAKRNNHQDVVDFLKANGAQ